MVSSNFAKTTFTVCIVSILCLVVSRPSMGKDVSVTSLSIRILSKSSDSRAVDPMSRHERIVIVHPGELLHATCFGTVPQFIAASVFNHQNFVSYTGRRRIWGELNSTWENESVFQASFLTEVDEGVGGWVACREIPLLDNTQQQHLATSWKRVIGIKEEDPGQKTKLAELVKLNWETDDHFMKQIQFVSSTDFTRTFLKQKASNNMSREAGIGSGTRFKIVGDVGEAEVRVMTTINRQGTEEEEEEKKKNKDIIELSMALISCWDLNHCAMVQHCFVQNCTSQIMSKVEMCSIGGCRLPLHPKFGGGMLKVVINGTSHFRFLVQGMDSRFYFADEPVPEGALIRLDRQIVNDSASNFICRASIFTQMAEMRLLSPLENGSYQSFPTAAELKDGDLPLLQEFQKNWFIQKGVTVFPTPGEINEVVCQIPNPYSMQWITLRHRFHGPEKLHWTADAIYWARTLTKIFGGIGAFILGLALVQYGGRLLYMELHARVRVRVYIHRPERRR